MIIKCHPQLILNDVEFLLERELKNTHIKGYISMNVLKGLFNLFSWVYLKGSIDEAFEDKQSSLYKLFAKFDLPKFKGDSISYSAVLFYNILNKIINIRKLELDIVLKASERDNKILSSLEFTFDPLKVLYMNNTADLSPDMLVFNTILVTTESKKVTYLENYGDVVRLTNISDSVRPDFKYRLAKKALRVNNIKKDIDTTKQLYVLQDSSTSMKKYVNKLEIAKSFILNEALKADYEVHWLYITDRINLETVYNKDTIGGADLSNVFFEGNVKINNILGDKRFNGENVVIITDGTDNFDFKFKTSTKQINIISFTDNIDLRNKIIGYGKFFRA